MPDISQQGKKSTKSFKGMHYFPLLQNKKGGLSRSRPSLKKLFIY